MACIELRHPVYWQVVRAERAAVGVEYVLGVGGFDLERVEAEVCGLCLMGAIGYISWAAEGEHSLLTRFSPK